MKRSKLLFPLLLLLLILAACSPQGEPVNGAPGAVTPGAGQPAVTEGAVPAAVEAARQDLANKLSIKLDDVKVVDFKQVDWTDSCLGLGGAAESCLAAITPGYSVTLEAGGKQVTYRTDLKGTALRPETVPAP